MTPTEFWWEFDAKMKVQKRIKQDKSGFSGSQWDRARKEHSRKMKERNG